VRTQESATDKFANLLKLEDDLAGRFGAKLAVSPNLATARPETFEPYRDTPRFRARLAAWKSRP